MVEIVPRSQRIALYLGLQLINTTEFSFIADSVQTTHPQHVAVKVSVEIKDIGFDRRFSLGFKCWPHANIGNALSPRAAHLRGGRIYAEFRDNTIVGPKVCGREANRMAPAIAAN